MICPVITDKYERECRASNCMFWFERTKVDDLTGKTYVLEDGCLLVKSLTKYVMGGDK